MIGHVGASLPSFHSLLVLLPARDAGFFVSFNGAGALPLTTGASAILLRDFTDAFVPDPLADTRLTPAGDPAAAAYAGSYRFANNPASSTTTVEKSAELLGGAVTVAVAPDGALHLHDAWGEKRLVAVGPGRFQEVDAGGRPGDDVLVFGTDAQGQVSGFALSSRSSQWFARLPWYATPAVGQALLLGCVVLFLGTLLGAAVGPLRRRTRRDPQEAPQKAPQNVPQSAVWARRLLLAAVGCSLLFVAAYAAVMLLAPQSIVAGETTLLAAVLALPVLGLALALACVGFTLAAWRGRWWSRWGRVAYTAITASLLLFAWVLSAWNLLGWHW
jgi:hypothetical protein